MAAPVCINFPNQAPSQLQNPDKVLPNLFCKPIMDWTSTAKCIDQLRNEPQTAHWSTRLVNICETIWAALNHVDNVDAGCIKQFITLLSLPDAIELARLVIPPLRDDPHEPTDQADIFNPFKQMILDQTHAIRMRLSKIPAVTQTQIDTPFYRQEKSNFSEAELFRASLLLSDQGQLTDPDEEEKVRLWLAQAPHVAGSSQTHPIDQTGSNDPELE